MQTVSNRTWWYREENRNAIGEIISFPTREEEPIDRFRPRGF